MDLNIRKKFVVFGVLTFFIMLGLIWVSLDAIGTVDRQTEQSWKRTQDYVVVFELHDHALNLVSSAMELLSYGGQGRLPDQLRESILNQSSFLRLRTPRLLERARTPEQKATATRLNTSIARLAELATQEILAAESAGALANRRHELAGSIRENAESIQLGFSRFEQAIRSDSHELVDAAHASFAWAATWMPVFGALALAALFGTLFLMNRGIVRPIMTMTSVVQKLSQGQTDVAIPHLGNSHECGQLALVLSGFKQGIIREKAVQAEREEALTRLAREKIKYQELVESLRDGIVHVDRQGRIVSFNRRFGEILGYDDAELNGRTYPGLTPHAWHKRDVEAFETELVPHGFSAPYEKEFIRRDGSLIPVDVQIYAERDDDGDLIGFRAMVRDVTPRKRNEMELRKLSYVVEQNPAIVLITDVNSVIEYVNPKFEESTGFKAEEVIGQNPRILKSGQVSETVFDEMWAALRNGKTWRGELHNRRKDGTFYWEDARILPLRNTHGEISHYVAIKEDITERKAIEEELVRQTYYDSLTGLPNRVLAFDRLSERIAHAKKTKSRYGILLLNIDGFSRINAELGQGVGDAFLVETTRRLSDCFATDESSLLCRLGADRFLIGMGDFQSTAMLELKAKGVLAAMRRPFATEHGDITLSGTIGITVFPYDGDNVDSLLRNAEVAVQRAREIGRNSYRFFISSRQRSRSLRMENLIQDAIGRNELLLHYQPIMSSANERCSGAEALIRWDSPEFGWISPNEFVPLFEDSELAHDIGAWILREALQRTGEYLRTTKEESFFISVNTSPRQLRRIEFVDTVMNALSDTGVRPDMLKLEITERLFVESRPEVLGVLEALNEAGVILTLDDFGTGYSALGSLHQLPIRCLKIDRSFVDRIGKDVHETAIVQTICQLCDRLAIDIVAEGVETADQARHLRAAGCTYFQGFMFSRPISWNRFIAGKYDPLEPPGERREATQRA